MQKKISSKIYLSILCIFSLLICGVFDKAALVTKASQNQTDMETNITPEELGFDRITIGDFNISDETYEAGTGMAAYGTYQKGLSLEGKYLDIDITTNAITTANLSQATCISYAGNHSGGWWGLRVYVTATALVFSTTNDLNVSQGILLKPLEILPTDRINLKLAVTKSGADMKVDVWVNNLRQEQMLFEGGATVFGPCLGVYVVDRKIAVETPAYEKQMTELSYDLDKSDAGYLITTKGTAYVNGEEYQDLSKPLDKPGNYVICKEEGNSRYIQNVSLYRKGDVNLNNVCGEQSDCDALQNIILGKLVSVAGEKAGDLNNDGVADIQDLHLLKSVSDGTTTLSSISAKYTVAAETYDFIGGDEVMPISGFYGPYSIGVTNDAGESMTYSYLTDEIFKLIADSGINMFSHTFNDYTNAASALAIEVALEKAEKYGLGMLVTDSALTDTKGDLSYVNMTDVQEIAKRIGQYSQYDSFLGIFCVDEPYTDEYNPYGWIDYAWENPQIKHFDSYMSITNILNQYANLKGYVNLNSLGTKHYTTIYPITVTNKQKLAQRYSDYLDVAIEDANVKHLSFDKYQFSDAEDTVQNATVYFSALDAVSAKAKDRNVPFWSYVQLGGDWRDDGVYDATNSDAIPTEAETYWQIHMPLAFGAKGLEYYTIIQPVHSSYDDTSGTASDCTTCVRCNISGVDCGHSHDFDCNGLIGADGQPTTHYAYAKKTNTHIAAVDEVLMKANHKGVVAAGQYAVNNTSGLQTVISGTDMLKSLDVTSNYGAIAGCFDYQGREAYYVVNYDVTTKQKITLEFASKQSYSVIMDSEKTLGKGTSVELEIAPGEGVLVVLDEEKGAEYVYFEDISAYRNKRGNHTAPEMNGYIFAGWFQGPSDTSKIVTEKTLKGPAYAKFVDAALLDVKAQVRYGDIEAIEPMDIRFVVTAESLKYTSMGFKFAYNNKQKEFESDVVSYTLNAWEEDQQEYVQYVPTDLCLSAKYFKAYTLYNVPISQFNTPIDVVAYWKTVDGTIVEGKHAIKRVYEGITCLTSPEDYGYEQVTIRDFGIAGDEYSADYYYGFYNTESLEGKYLDVDVILPDNGDTPGHNGTRLSFASNDMGGWYGVRTFNSNGYLCVGNTSRAYRLSQYGISVGERFNLKVSIKDIDETNNTCTVGIWINNMFAGCSFESYAGYGFGNILSVARVAPCGEITVGIPTK